MKDKRDPVNVQILQTFHQNNILYTVYDSGTVFAPEVLDITDEDIRKKFVQGVQNVASVCLQIGYPTIASVPHSIVNGFKNLLAVAAETDITFPEAEQVKLPFLVVPHDKS